MEKHYIIVLSGVKLVDFNSSNEYSSSHLRELVVSFLQLSSPALISSTGGIRKMQDRNALGIILDLKMRSNTYLHYMQKVWTDK